MAVAFGPSSCHSGLVPKSELLHSPEVQYGFVSKLSLHGGKNIALRAEKPFFSSHSFFSGAQRNGVFASEDVLRCEAMWGDVKAGVRACSQVQSHDSSTEARRAKTSAEGFLRFLFAQTVEERPRIEQIISALSAKSAREMGKILTKKDTVRKGRFCA